jgi:hypothetical protein
MFLINHNNRTNYAHHSHHSIAQYRTISLLRNVFTTFLISVMFLYILIGITVTEAIWQENILPKRRITQLKESDVQRFLGNQTDSDHFKLLEQDGDSLLVGARNIVYNISLTTLEENKRLQWYSSDDDIRMCKYKGKSEEFCQNYIRVLAKKSENSIFVCGTNAFKPKCRQYLENVRNVIQLCSYAVYSL